MQEKRGESFEGRQWLFDEIDQWLAAGTGRTLLIRADFGVGKSALLSEYVARHRANTVVAWHFCQHDTQATLRPETFVRSIAAQLGEALPAYREIIETSLELQKRLDEADADPASTFEAAVLAPLGRMPSPGPARLLVVDAVDEGLEVDPAGQARKRVTLVDLLARKAARFPTWLRLLISSRPNPQVLTPLGAAATLRQIDAESAGNQDDLRRFVLDQASRGGVRERLKEAQVAPAKFADSLLSQSGGKFLFVVHALRDLASGALSVKEIASLPPGMDAFYLDSFERRFGPGAEHYGDARELLGVMCAAREPLSRGELAEILEGSEQSVRAIQSQLPDFLRLRSDRLNFDHASLKEWLTQENEEGISRAGYFAVDLQAGGSRLRSWALSRLKSGTAHTSSYLLRNLAEHLKNDAERYTVYAELLLERFAWSHARLKTSGVPGLLADTELIPGHPERARLKDLVRNSELTLRRSANQWCAQVLGRLGSEGSNIGLQPLLASAKRWISDPAQAQEMLVPCTRSLRWVAGQDLMLEGSSRTPGSSEPSPPLAVLPDGRIVSEGAGHTLRVCDPRHGAEPLVLHGHTGEILALALLPDGRIASGARDRTVRVWDPLQSAPPVIFKGHTGPILALVAMPDGRIVSGGWDGTVRVWDLKAGIQHIVLKGHAAQVRALAVLTDARIVSGSDDGTLRVWDLAREAPIVLEGHSARIVALAVLLDGRIVSSAWDCTLRVWDLKQPAEPTVLAGHSGAVGPLTVLSDGRIVSGSDDGTVRVWNLTREEPIVLEGHSGWVWSLAVLPGGRIVSGSCDCTVRVWDLGQPGEPMVFEGHSSEVHAVAVLPDGRIVSSASDGTLRVWDVKRPTAPVTHDGYSGTVDSLAVLPDGHLVRAADDHSVHVCDLQQRADPLILQGHSAEILALAVLPDGRLVSSARDRTVRVWNPLQTSCESIVLEGHAGAVGVLAVLPDGRIASGSYDRSVRVWDPNQRSETIVLKGHSNRIRALAVLPDGRIVSGSLDNTVRVWDPQQPEHTIVLEGHSNRIRALAVMPDGRIVSGSRDRTVRVWDLKKPQEAIVLEAHTGEIKALAVLPDGCIVSGSEDCTLRLWDLRLKTEPIVLEGHSGEVRAIALLPDGDIVSGASDSTVRVWSQALRETQQSFIADAAVRCLALSAGRIIAGCADGTVHVLSRQGLPAPQLASQEMQKSRPSSPTKSRTSQE
jgi:WD40 repeat protein